MMKSGFMSRIFFQELTAGVIVGGVLGGAYLKFGLFKSQEQYRQYYLANPVKDTE
ncbi:hypothetical protein SARC_10114 [Sphaeroforma arctica JP610]|uniref:Uncharacterized protein n=1 Tax=Sphaeroforma arctica JP610 TaxID=667725 RepID=A0A0L0FN16_9EUKA|nr:hypothetical protein SARC_10114 [Sphaeroforma arctica JP610]KNC77428.1 hypothetical protein SARC_10114 [Sphaeroforma arctica JP610]|eukprot:XP_014151330.1 hypothetical protein SARC_10114 [Sphaeroforma arctica JP610]